MEIARNSTCPSGRWHDHVAPLIAQRAMTMLNVGANKGWVVHDWLHRYSPRGVRPPPNRDTWRRALRSVTWKPCGGACSHCTGPPPPHAGREVSNLTVHAFDFLSANARLLTRLFREYNISGAVHHAAVSNRIGTAYEPERKWPPGDELQRPFQNRHGSPVEELTLDDFVGRHNVHHVSLLTVDAEGFDGLILEGARALLDARRIELLEFEYHGVGAWGAASREYGPRRNLSDILSWLDGAGYSCFWQGNSGALAPASGRWWDPAFEFRAWSNLVCSCLPAVVRELGRCCGAAMR